MQIESVPAPRLPLHDRLAWTMEDPFRREAIAAKHLQESTDLIRGTKIPLYHKHQLPFTTQARLIHHAHMTRKEHIVLNPNQSKHLIDRPNFPSM